MRPQSAAPLRPKDAGRAAAPDGSPPNPWAKRVFWVALLIAIPVIRYQGREQWFFLDEWDFLAGRDLRSAHDLLRPHNEHWSTIPVLVYRLLFRTVGLNHYWPYQAFVIGAHLGVAALLRAVMRRSGVDPWIATALAVVFLFLGSGQDNITWAFQMSFTGAILFGLAHTLLADHGGGLGRRDALGIACGLAALMCSGVGLAMAIGAGTSILLRRGWKAALVHLAPLALAFSLWSVTQNPVSATAGTATGWGTVWFGWRMVQSTFVQVGSSWAWAAVLAVMTAAGVARAMVGDRPAVVLRTQAITLGTTVSALAFVGFTSIGRAGLQPADLPAPGRYVHVITSLSIPVIGFAASALAKDHTVRKVAIIAFLLIGLPGNFVALQKTEARVTLGSEQAWSELGALSLEGGYPRTGRPAPTRAPEVTMGWLSSTAAAGRMPVATTVTEQVRANTELTLSLERDPEPRTGPCRRVGANEAVRVRRGQQIRVAAPTASVIEVINGRPRGRAAFFDLPTVSLRLSGDPRTLRFGGGPAEVCR